jgi:NAD(P)-dependent dehydrogenase (short-subunit alcohol dehydrogenase family)
MAGRVAIVAGGTGALGQSICLAFLSTGVTVCVPYAVPEETDALRARLAPAEAPRLDPAPCDVTDEAAVNRFVAGVLERHGRVALQAATSPRPRWPSGTACSRSTSTPPCSAAAPCCPR